MAGPVRAMRKKAIRFLPWLVAGMAFAMAVPVVAVAADKPILEYLYGWGQPGTGTGQFRAVRGIAAYDRKSINRTLIVVADGGRDMLRSYTWDMMFIDKWGEAGKDAGQFHEPRGVAVDPEGNIIVADSANHRIQKTAIGTTTFLERPGLPVMQFGSHGTGTGQFDMPTGVAVDGDGNILVADTLNHRIQKFDAKGKFLATWGRQGNGNGMLFMPTYLAIDRAGHVYVADSGNNRIQVFDAQGKYLSSIGSVGKEPGHFAEPKGIALDAKGNLWVVDRRNHRLQAFAPDGRSMGTFGKQGPGNGEFNFPEDLAFDSSGRLFVTDGMNGRIQVFKPVQMN